MTYNWNPPRHFDGNYCIAPATMRTWEAAEIDAIANRGRELMEIAGREVAQYVLAQYPNAQEILIICGAGNNGGDGFAAAWYLSHCNIDVHLFVLEAQGAKTPDALYMFERVKSLSRFHIRNANDAGRILEWSRRRDVVVIDAIFGTGYKPRHDIRLNRIYQCISDLSCPVVSIDMPSGVDANTGYCGAIDDERPPRAIFADATVTFAAPKFGHFFGDGPAHCGNVVCVDIGLAPYSSPDYRCLVLSDELCHRQFAPNTQRRIDLHKGNCGHVVVIGGAASMPGAASLSARAALRSGCGLATLATRAPVATCDEIMRTTICDEAGTFCPEKLAPLLDAADCLVVGPGLGRDETALQIIHACESFDKRIVLDADALWALTRDEFAFAANERYITPHPAEAARLLQTKTRDILYHPVESAQALTAKFGVTTVLKSHVTLIAGRPTRVAPGRLAVNPYPNPAIATAGAGDVFAGILGGVVAQARCGAFCRWFDAFEAAAWATHLHSVAGRHAAQSRGNGTCASDIIQALATPSS